MCVLTWRPEVHVCAHEKVTGFCRLSSSTARHLPHLPGSSEGLGAEPLVLEFTGQVLIP